MLIEVDVIDSQDQVDMADEFTLVLARVEKWFESLGLGTKHRFAVATDGYFNSFNKELFYSFQ